MLWYLPLLGGLEGPRVGASELWSKGPFGAAAHELRRCKYTPNPTIDYDYHPTYTDPDFTCDTWTACEGWRPKVSGTKDDSDSKA